MMSNTWPSGVSTFIGIYNSSKAFDRNCCGSRQLTNQAGAWQETAILYRAGAGDAYVRLKVVRVDSARNDGHIWLDDIYVGEGIGFEQPPAEKKAFDGAMVRIDELGNFEVLQQGGWKAFFPFCIYQDVSKPTYQIYSDQGFNCVMFNQLSTSIAQKAKDAVSPHNPDGMMAMGGISYWTQPGYGGFGNIESLMQKMQVLVNSPQISNILAYYWDNEAYDQYDFPKLVTDTIKVYDVDQDGQRLHPIYMLQGNEGMARMYNEMVDSVGTYVVGGLEGHWGGETGLPVLDNIEGQRNPLGIGIIPAGDRSARTAGGFRRYFYNLLIAGAKGMAYYRDPTHGDEVPLDTLSVWPEFEIVRQEIDQLLPLIRQPHWTTWETTSSSDVLNLGTRDYDGEGYIILVNPMGASETATISIHGLPYTVEAGYDYFTGKRVVDVSNNTLMVTLPAYGTAVFRLERIEGKVCQADLDQDGAIDTSDIQLMVNVILGATSGEICADLNGDGAVNVQDLQTLVNYIAGVM
jgi:hypothetical protein